MRRPLFGTGTPRNILPGADAVQVFNTAELNQNSVYALTLFLWVPKVPTPDVFGFLPALSVTVKDSGTALAAPIVSLSKGFLETKVGSVVKILDKMPLSGQQAVYVQNVATPVPGSTPQCFVYGYFEQGGVHEITIPFRGLDKPSAFTPPFVFEPTVLTGSAAQTALVHRLDSSNLKYIDVVNLDVTSSGNAGDPEPAISFLGINSTPANASEAGAMILAVAEDIEEPVRIFPGIPFRSENAAVIQLGLLGGVDPIAAAWGGFRRV